VTHYYIPLSRILHRPSAEWTRWCSERLWTCHHPPGRASSFKSSQIQDENLRAQYNRVFLATRDMKLRALDAHVVVEKTAASEKLFRELMLALIQSGVQDVQDTYFGNCKILMEMSRSKPSVIPHPPQGSRYLCCTVSYHSHPLCY
jgi:hypothetical protein